mmetsp:Transcript_75340/g.201285  ORF Transcript_75340/g.201285 Transcript_75340/m.201285 type:complete len:368 (-) Transcript_75340:94-1197(-)
MVPTAAAVFGLTCQWNQGAMNISWTPQSSSDYYEVQLAVNATADPFVVHSTAGDSVVVDSLLPSRKYYVTMRTHAADTPSLGPGTWGQPADRVVCESGADAAPQRTKYARADTKLLEVMRESEYTYEVDYLMNHNSGTIEADAAFASLGAGKPDKKSPWNITFYNATFTLYCVEMLKVDVPDTFSTGGNTSYSDYMSCNDNHNATDPQCICDNWIDRILSKVNPDGNCHDSRGNNCTYFTGMKDCTCTCSQESLDNSNKYIGMMPVYMDPKDDYCYGQWFSHPKPTECDDDEEVGAARADGSVCTWKRHREARVVKGWQVLDNGFNTSHARKLDPARALQNTKAFLKSFADAPLQQWACEDTASILV